MIKQQKYIAGSPDFLEGGLTGGAQNNEYTGQSAPDTDPNKYKEKKNHSNPYLYNQIRKKLGAGSGAYQKRFEVNIFHNDSYNPVVISDKGFTHASSMRFDAFNPEKDITNSIYGGITVITPDGGGPVISSTYTTNPEPYHSLAYLGYERQQPVINEDLFLKQIGRAHV